MVMGFAGAASGLAVLFAVALNTASTMNQRQVLQTLADETALALAVEINVLSQNKVDLNSVALLRINAVLAAKGEDLLQANEVRVRILASQSVPLRPRKATLTTATLSLAQSPTRAPDDTIEVVIETYPTPSPARSALNQAPKPIQVSARAQRLGSSNLCVIALHSSLANTLFMEGSARLTAPNCDVISNSISASGMNVAGAAKLTGTEIHSAGGALGQSMNYSPEATTDSLAMPDPLTSIPEPPTAPCISVPRLANKVNTPLAPGVYCGGLKLNGHRAATLSSGV